MRCRKCARHCNAPVIRCPMTQERTSYQITDATALQECVIDSLEQKSTRTVQERLSTCCRYCPWLLHRARPHIPTCQPLADGWEDPYTQLFQCNQVSRCKRVVPHERVHCRGHLSTAHRMRCNTYVHHAHQQGLVKVPRSHDTCQQVVTEATRKLGHRVGRQWCYDHEVCPSSQLNVQHRVANCLPRVPFVLVPCNTVCNRRIIKHGPKRGNVDRAQ